MAFDADAFVAALECPSFTSGGRTFSGRILSVPEWMRLLTRKAELEARTEQSYDEVQALVLDMVRTMFPRPWYLPYNPAVVAFGKLPFKAQMLAIEDFCVSQAANLPTSPPPRDERKTGSVSPGDT